MFSRFTRRGSSRDEKKQSETPAVQVTATSEVPAPVGGSLPQSGTNSQAHSEQSSSGRALPVSTGQAGSSSLQSTQARFAVGIDLGTTHCVLAYMPLEGGHVTILPIPQIKEPGVCGEFQQLPSFLYVPHQQEFGEHDFDLPWTSQARFSDSLGVVGEFARSHGSKTPMRLVSSAKSWLGHSGVNCKEKFLPLDVAAEVVQVSPYEVTRQYLQHLLAAWQQRFPLHSLAYQALTITVPASFDPLARELTVEAAQSLGLHNAVLLEEPQAALYGWLNMQADAWRKCLTVGDVILVVDVGGGTTDFSLINVVAEAGELVLERIAVGDHILLGGDNMDLTLAYVLKSKLEKEGKKLEHWQLQGLTHGCRLAKEALLLNDQLTAVPVVVPSRGASLIGGSLRTELTRGDVLTTLVEGFFPQVSIDESPVKRPRAALTRKSLPFAQDPGITRHLAEFLANQGNNSEPSVAQRQVLYPSVLLFNGGVFKAPSLAGRLLGTLNKWLEFAGKTPVKVLAHADLDHAVAQGAAYYAYVRCGHGVKIRGGSARSYYVGIESAMPAVPGFDPPVQAYCIAPYGMEEGSQAAVPDEEFGLVVGEPAVFRFYSSSNRKNDVVGTLLEHWSENELEELESISVNLPAEGVKRGDIIAVKLQARLTEVGTLKLEALALKGGQRWNVEFNVRDAVSS